MAFEWVVVNGSCAACEAMVGLWDEEPQRPHDYCDCDVFEDIFDEEDGLSPGTCWGDVDIDDPGTYVDGVVTMFVDVHYICGDGSEVDDSFTIEQSLDEWLDAWIDNPDGAEWEEWHEEAQERIHAMCEGELEDECTTFEVPSPFDIPSPPD